MQALDKNLKPGMSPLQKIDAYVSTAVSLHKQEPSPLLFLEDQQRHFGIITKKEFGEQSVTSRLSRWIDQGKSNSDITTNVPTPFLVAMIVGQVTKWAVMSSTQLAPKTSAAKWLKQTIHSAMESKNP